jgi:hypothetical protein
MNTEDWNRVVEWVEMRLEARIGSQDPFEKWWSNNGIVVHPLQDISAANLAIKQCARAAWLASK